MVAAGYGYSDIGRVRRQNQDTIFVSTEPVGPLPNLYIVADGMGGHKAGDVASAEAVTRFCGHILKNPAVSTDNDYLDLMVAAATAANQEIFTLSLADPALHGMGTTFTACVVDESKCEILHIGDSRAYRVTGSGIEQLTADHSYVNEMVKAGQLTQSEAREHPRRNVLTRVLGVGPDVEADGYIRKLEPACTLLLCSDGLTNMLPDADLRAVAAADAPVKDRVHRLVDMANAKGGHDNISVILIDIR